MVDLCNEEFVDVAKLRSNVLNPSIALLTSNVICGWRVDEKRCRPIHCENV